MDIKVESTPTYVLKLNEDELKLIWALSYYNERSSIGQNICYQIEVVLPAYSYLHNDKELTKRAGGK